MARGELTEHAAKVCPREPVACAVGGCGAVVARGGLAAHAGGDAPAITRHVGALAAVAEAEQAVGTLVEGQMQ